MKRFIKSGLERLGLVIHKKPDVNRSDSVFDSAVEALYYEHVDQPYTCPSKPSMAFKCPVDKIVSSNGFNHSNGGWHPFSSTLEEFEKGKSECYNDSLLKKYYDTWRPNNGLEAIVGWGYPHKVLANIPSYVILPPWNPNTIDQEEEAVRSWTSKDNREHGEVDFGIEHGCNYHGPVSEEKGEIEYNRLASVYESIKEKGYDRSYGDVCVNVLRRGQEYRYMAVGGHHRIAAVKALGYTYVPSRFRMHWIIDVDEAELWPQVRRGVWSKDAAVSYLHHLFDFDAREWARSQGILNE